MDREYVDSDGLSFVERSIEREYYYNLDNFTGYDDIYDESDNDKNSDIGYSLIELYINDKLDRYNNNY